VVLPSEQDSRPVRIRPASVPEDPAYRDYVVQPGWRIIATTNVLDRALLFDLSFALMRRFAFVDVGAPDLDGYRQLVRDAVADGPPDQRDRAEDLVGRLLPLTAVQPPGPALFIDAARYVASYVAEHTGTATAIRTAAGLTVRRPWSIDRPTGRAAGIAPPTRRPARHPSSRQWRVRQSLRSLRSEVLGSRSPRGASARYLEVQPISL